MSLSKTSSNEVSPFFFNQASVSVNVTYYPKLRQFLRNCLHTFSFKFKVPMAIKFAERIIRVYGNGIGSSFGSFQISSQ